VIHGDFHPGQTLRDGAGTVWLVDLDDLALAPPEADFGNLAAWMATQSPQGLTRGDPTTALKSALRHILPQARLGMADVSPDLALHFGRIALLRRALKLAHRGAPWALARLGQQQA
jgi:aminoglycoside phosphotransferase (APT) family kinase protein